MSGLDAPVLIGMTLVDLGLFGFGLNPAIAPEWHELRAAGDRPVARGAAAGRPCARPGRRTAARRADAVRPLRPPELRLGRAGEQPGLVRPDLRVLRLRIGRAGAISPGSRRSGGSTACASRESVRSSRRQPPPAGAFDRVETIGRVWIAWLDAKPWVEAGSKAAEVAWSRRPGRAVIRFRTPLARPDYRPRDLGPRLEGSPRRPARCHRQHGPGPFLAIQVPRGEHQMILEYDPAEVRIGSMISACRAGLHDSRLDRNPPVLNSWNNAERGLDGPEPPS